MYKTNTFIQEGEHELKSSTIKI